MAILDLDMEDDARELEQRLERERLERRAREEADPRGGDESPIGEADLAGLDELARPSPDLRSPSQPGEHARVMAEARGEMPTAITYADPRPSPTRGPNGELAWIGTPTRITGPPDPRVARVAEALDRRGGERIAEERIARGEDADPAAHRRPLMHTPFAGAPLDPRILERDAEPERPPPRSPRASDLRVPPELARGAPAGDRAVPLPAEPDPAAEDDGPIAKPAERPRPTGEDALDAGLPSHGDIDRERAIDVPRRIMNTIARALGASAGHRVEGFQSRADELQGQRDRGMRDRMAGKSQARDDERAAAAAQESQATRRRRLEIEEAEGQREAEAAERDDLRQEMLARGQRDLTTARTRVASGQAAEQERATARDEALDLPDSDATIAARRALTVRVAGLPPAQQRAILGALGGSEGIGRMTGREALAYLEHGRLPQPPQARMGAGGAGGGGGARRAPQEASPERRALLADAEQAGIRAGTAGAMNDAQLARAIEIRTRRDAPRAALEILPGVRATLPLGTNEPGQVRQRWAQAASHYGALENLRRFADENGLAATITPGARDQIASEIAEMRALYAAIQGTGVINPSEAPLIEASIPNPTDLAQMTYGDLRARVDSFEARIVRSVTAELGSRGVDDAGIDTAIQLLRRGGRGARPGPARRATDAAPSGAEAPQTAPQTGDRVPVLRVEDGQVGTVSRAVWERDQQRPEGERRYRAPG